MKIELTPEQLNHFGMIVDTAIKAGGISVARIGLPLFDCVDQQIREQLVKEQQEEKPELNLA